MKKILLLIMVSTIVGCQYLCSQTKFGEATIDELNMVSYPQDTTAAAVILLKDADMAFVYDPESGFQYEYTLKMKIKILKTEGLDWCDHSISYYDGRRDQRERIRNLSGTTYSLENGKIVKTKLSKEHISDEDVNEKSKLKKFALPAAKVGSVIEYKYTIVSDFYFDLRDFYFQHSIPTAEVRYEVSIPEYFNYNINMQGYAHINTKKQDDNIKINTGSGILSCSGVKTIFQGSNISAMKDKGYVWSINDYISKVTFELSWTKFPGGLVKAYTSTWENVDKEIFDASVFGGNLKKAGMFKDDISKKEQTIENAREILNMIKYRVKWNEKNSMYPENMGDALKKGLGNSGDMNFLLYNALKAGGFEAYPVVLSTRNKGRIPISHPSLATLNYTIVGVKLDTLMYFADASARFGDWNILPEESMVTQARVLDQRGSWWIDLSTISSRVTVIIGSYNFTDNVYVGKIQYVNRDQDAYDFKLRYLDYKNEDEYIEKLSARLACEVQDFKISGVDEPGVDVKKSFTIVKPDIILGEEYLYINPIVDKQYSENPFKSETREIPVMFSNLENYKQVVSIDVPEGYVVEELPKSERFVLGDDDIVFTYRIVASVNKISLNYQFQIKNLLILQSEYPALREFFAKVVNKNSEQIILKKL